jgi:hypothetical protein
MRNYLLILALVSFRCTSNQQQSKQNGVHGRDEKCFSYPATVDSLHVRDLYDSARWFIYTWHCDQNYLSKSDSSKSVTFGELPLNFKNLAFKHNTIEINFSFMDKEEAILPSMTKDIKELSTGVGFDITSKQKVYMLSPNGFSTTLSGGANRYENPLQPEVLTYIESNWNKLNSCFKELAERKGIMK